MDAPLDTALVSCLLRLRLLAIVDGWAVEEDDGSIVAASCNIELVDIDEVETGDQQLVVLVAQTVEHISRVQVVDLQDS